MKKRLWIPAVVLVFLCWGVLSNLGKRVLPAAPLTQAWMISFGATAYHHVVSGLIPPGSDRNDVEDILGKPDSEMRSLGGDGRFSLAYSIPQDSDGAEILISFGPDSQVLGTELLRN